MMEGAAEQTGDVFANQELHPPQHLPRSLVRKREQKDIFGKAACLDQPRDPVGYNTRFAGPCTGEHKRRPVTVHDRG
ncbi:MAG TPA: hypothetical protein VEP69_04065, partial [Thermodesulfovibrionales bacterium]|nr:hypothetical protein [Thermodesulfovibrionales bacterium]